MRAKTANCNCEMDQTGGGEPILSDGVLVNGALTSVTLTADGLLRWTDGGSQQCLSVDKEALGFSAEGSRIEIRAVVDSGSIGCCGSRGALVRKIFVFEPLSEDSQRLWCQRLQEYMDSLGRPRRLFIFLNPFGGKKSASKIFLDDVKPLLEDANVKFTVQETKYQLHAKEVSRTLDLSKYDGIVCVSGDGILVEVVNGLLERADWNAAIKVPLGVVPAGTGNGMAKSLLDSVGLPCTAFNAILAIIQGNRRSLDIATILQGETRFFSVLMLAWDIDIESEKYRWMGSARMGFYALQRIFHLRKYNGCISFVPAPGFENYGVPSSQKDELHETIMVQQFCYGGPTVDLESLHWKKIDGPFLSVWLHNVPWGGEDAKAAPDAEFSDGYLDLIVIRNCPKLALLALMSEICNGNHVKSSLSCILSWRGITAGYGRANLTEGERGPYGRRQVSGEESLTGEVAGCIGGGRRVDRRGAAATQ